MATGQLMFEVGIQKANDEYDKIYGEIMKLVELGKGGIDLKVKFEQTTELKRFVEAIKQVGDGKLLEPLLNKIEQLQVSMVKLGMVPKVNYNDLANQLNKVTRAYEDYQASIKKHGEGSAVAKQYFEGWQAQVGKLEKVFEMPEKVAREALNTYQNLGNTVVSNMERIGGSKAGMETLAHSVNDMASSVESLTKKIGGLVTEMSNLGKVKATEKIAGDLSDADKGTKQIAVALKNAMDKLKASKGEVSEAERELDRSTNSTNNALAVEKENVAALANELKTAERAIHSAAVAAKELSVILGGNSEGVNKFIALASTMDALNLKQASIMTDKNLTFDAKREQLEGVRKEMDAVAKEMDELKKNAAVGNPLIESFTNAFDKLNTALASSGALLKSASTSFGEVGDQLGKVTAKASKDIKIGANADAQKQATQAVKEATTAVNEEAEAYNRLNEYAQKAEKTLNTKSFQKLGVMKQEDGLISRNGRLELIGNYLEGMSNLKNKVYGMLYGSASSDYLVNLKDEVGYIKSKYASLTSENKESATKLIEEYKNVISAVEKYKAAQQSANEVKQSSTQATQQLVQSEQNVSDAQKNTAQSAKDVVAALKEKAQVEKSAQSATDGGKAAKDAQNTTAAVNEEAEAFRKLMTEMNTFKGSIESLVGSIRSLVEQLQKMHTSTPQIIDNNALLSQAKVVEDLRKKLTSMTLKGDSGMLVPKEGVKAEEALRIQDKLTAEQQKFNEVLTRGASVAGSYAEAIQQLGQKYNLTAEQAARLASLIGSGELKRGDVQKGLRIGYNKAGDIVETINALKQLKQVESQPTPAAQSVFDQSKFTGLQEAIDKVIKEVNRLQEAFKHLGENNSLSNLSTTVNGLAVTLSTLSNAFKFTANTEELAAYEAKIKSLQQTIAQLEAKANGLVASAKQVNTEMKTIGESKGSEATYNKNLDKLQAALEKVKQSIDTVQPKRDAFKDAGLSDEVLEGKYNKLLAIREALEKAMGNKDLLSKAGAISSIKIEGTDIMALGEMTKTLRSDKGVKQLAADFERLTANAEQSRQSIQLVMQRPIEGDMLEQVVAKNKERLAEIRKYIVDEFRYLKEQMKLASKEGIDITPAIADRTRLRNEVQELGASFKQINLENTKEVDNLMKAYIRLFAQVNAQSNILRQGVSNKKGGYEAEIERARVAYAWLLKDTDQLRIKREQLSKSGQDTSALDAQIQKAKEFLYILDRIQKRGFYGDFTTASILRSADFKTIAPYAWDEIQKGQEQARQDKAAQREAERQEKLAQKQAEAIRAAEEAKRNERNNAWIEQDAQRKKELEAIEKQGAKTLQAQQTANEKALASAQKADEQKTKSAENAAKRREEANERATQKEIQQREAVLRKEQELNQKQANKATNDRAKSASDAVLEYKRLEEIITRLNALGMKAIGANVDTTKVDDLIHRLEILQRIYKNIYDGGGRDAAGRSFGDIKGVDQVRATMLDIRSIFTEIPQKIRESEQATKVVANAERSIQSEIDKTLSLRKKIEASIARGEAAGRDMSGLKAQNDALEKQVNLLKAVKSGIKAGTVSPTDNILTKRIQETQLLRDDTEMLRKSQERLNAAQEKANKAKDKQATKTLKDEIKSVDDAWEKYNKLGVKIQELKDLRERGINANIDTSSVLAYINNLEQLRTLLKEIFSYNGRTLSTGSIGSANFSQGMLFKDVMKNFNGAGIEDANKYNLKGFKQNLSDAEANMRKAERAAAALDVKIQNIEARKLDFKDLDTSRLDAAIQRLREIQTELLRVASGMYGTRFSVADVTKTMNLAGANREVTNATKELQAAQTSAASAVRQMAIEEQRLDKALHEVNNSAKTQSQMMSDLKMMATQYLGVWGAQQFFRNIIEIGGQLEKQRLSLRAILGDAAQAEELFGDIKKLAIKSPFGVVELDQFTKQLSAYGFKYNELFDMTKRLADISAGAGTEVSRLALALGHVRAEGALSGYTLRQFAMNNIPMVQKLSERFTQLEGKIVSVSDIRKRVSKKEIGYEDVEAVIKDLTNEGGMFYNMQEVISESVQAKFKNLKDSMDIMYGEMAKGGIGDVLKFIANTLTDLTRQWKVLLPVIGAATAYWGMQKLAVMGVNAQITKYGVAAKVLTGQTYKLTAEQVKNLAVTGQISQRQLLIAVASRRLTVEQAELAASTYGLNKAQLQEVFASGAVEKSLLGSSVATSKYTIAQLRAMAATKVTATKIVWLNNALTVGKRAWLGASAAASKFWVSLKAMSSSIAWLAAIELAVTAITRAMQKSSERSERMSSMLETAREGFKNMNQNAVNFKVGVSLELSESELRTQIDAMKQELKEYSPQVGNVFAEAFKLDKSGKNVHTMAEQYEILAKAIDDTKDAYKEFEKIADLFELSNDATDGVWDDSLRENISDYIGTLKEQRSAEFELLKNRIKLSSSIEALRNDYESLNTVLQENFEQYKKSGGKLGFSEDDILKQIELIKSFGQEYEKNFKNLNKGLPGYVGDEEANKLKERKRIYDAFNKSVYGELSEYNKAVNKSQYQWQKVVEDGAVYTSNLVRSLEIVFKKSASNFNKAEQLAVQKGIQTFLNGIDGFKDLAREERIKIEKELLKPFPNIKIDVEVEDAYQQLTSFQQYLQSITSKAWTVNIKTLNTISDVAEAGRKNRKENEQTLKDTSGILKKSGYENKRLQSLGKALYEEGKIQQATADAVDATENLNNTLRTDWGGMQVQADKTNESLSSTQKAINDYVDGMKDATEEQKKAARERIQAYANEEANKALEERGYDLSDNKNKGKGEDRNAKAVRERVRVIKEAADAYQYWREKVGDASAWKHVEDEFGSVLKKIGITAKNIEDVRTHLNNIPKTKEYKAIRDKKVKTEIDKEIAKENDQYFRKDFEKSTEEFLSKTKIEIDQLTRSWKTFNTVRDATGDVNLAVKLSGVDFELGLAENIAEEMKKRIEKTMREAGVNPIVLNVEWSDEDIKNVAKDAFAASKPIQEKGESNDAYKKRLMEYESRIKSLQEQIKKWRDLETELRENAVVTYVNILKDADGLKQKVREANTEYEKQISHLRTLRDLEAGNKNKISDEEYNRLTKKIDVNRRLTIAGDLTGILDWSATSQFFGKVFSEAGDELRIQLDKFISSNEFKSMDVTQQKKYLDLQANIDKSSGKYSQPLSKTTWDDLSKKTKKVQESFKTLVEATKNLVIAQDEEEEARKAAANAKVNGVGVEAANNNLTVATFKRVNAENAVNKANKDVINAEHERRTAEEQAVRGLNGLNSAISNITSGSLVQLTMGFGNLIEMFTGKEKLSGTLSELLGASSGTGQIIAAVLQLLDMLKDHAAEKVEEMVRGLFDAVTGIIKDFLSGKLTEAIIEAAVEGVGNIVAAILENVPNMAMGGLFTGNGLVAGSVTGLVKGLGSGFGSAIENLFGFDANNSNEKEVREAIERLTKENEHLAVVIEEATNELKKSSGMRAVNASKEALDAQEKYNSNILEKWDNAMGYHSAHHSNGYYWDLDASTVESVNAALERYAKKTGTEIKQIRGDVWEDFMKLTPEEMKYIRTQEYKAWEDITSEGYYDWAYEYLNEYADQAEKLEEIKEELREKLTLQSFSGLHDQFVNELMDMEKSAKDFSKDFSKMLMKAVLNAQIADLLDDQLKTWRDTMADYMEQDGDTLSPAHIDALQDMWDDIVKNGLKIRDQVASATGYKGDGSSSGLASNIKTITEETAELLASYLNAVRADVAVNRQLISQYFPMFYQKLTQGNDSLKSVAENTLAIMRSNDAIKQSNDEILSLFRGLRTEQWKVPVA